jgi:hypothetical protein
LRLVQLSGWFVPTKHSRSWELWNTRSSDTRASVSCAPGAYSATITIDTHASTSAHAPSSTHPEAL